MNTRPNGAQELYDPYASSDKNRNDDYVYGDSYNGDGDAYEDWPDDIESCFPNEDDYFEIDDYSIFFDENGLNIAKSARRERRRADALAKKRFLETAAIVTQNLRARLLHADRHPKQSIYKYQVAKRLMATAQKMGMDI